jgi:hypothetical protein
MHQTQSRCSTLTKYVLLMWVTALPVLAFADSTTNSKPSDATEQQKRRELLGFTIDCVRIDDRQPLGWRNLSIAIGSPDEQTKNRIAAAKKWLTVCDDPPTAEPSVSLTGTGTVTVYVTKKQFEAAADAAKADASELRLYLNGFDQGENGKLLSQQVLGDRIRLQFRVARGKQNRSLWTALYQEKGLIDESNLDVALGWSTVGPTAKAQSQPPGLYHVRVSDEAPVAAAFVWIAILLTGSLWVLYFTDTFRDAPTPSFWGDAKRIRRSLFFNLRINGLKRAAARSESAVVEETLKSSQYGALFDSRKLAGGTYSRAAEQALSRIVPSEQQVPDVVFGLATRGGRWNAVRATFSLGRVQVGAWFLFAVATGVFLRVVYGQLPELPTTMLALVTLSAVTALASYSVDTNSRLNTYLPTKGLLLDLVTGPDDKQQLHRFQAIVVNVLLLSVGILEVISELAYPTFDASWLAFIGISGAALTMGKQLTEAAAVQQGQPVPDKSTVAGTNSSAALANVPPGPKT